MSYGLGGGTNARTLRMEICRYMESNPNERIADTPLSEWIKWDSRCSVKEYELKPPTLTPTLTLTLTLTLTRTCTSGIAGA